jgi:hypothetical protein
VCKGLPGLPGSRRDEEPIWRFQPSLRDGNRPPASPGVETPGCYRSSLRDDLPLSTASVVFKVVWVFLAASGAIRGSFPCFISLFHHRFSLDFSFGHPLLAEALVQFQDKSFY